MKRGGTGESRMYVGGWRKEEGEGERERGRGRDVVKEGGGEGECGPMFCDHHLLDCLNYFPSPGGTLVREAVQTSTPLPRVRVEQRG